MGKYADSERYARELLTIADKLNNRWTMLYARNNLGLALASLQKHEEASFHLLKGLEIAREMRAVPVALETMTGLAMIKAQEGDTAFALELYSFILNHPSLIEDTRDLVRPLYDELAAGVDAGVLETAEARAKEKDASWYWETLIGPD